MIRLNRVIIAGRLVRDPEIRHIDSGAAIARFTVAVKRRRARNAKPDYIDVVAWDKLAEMSNTYLKKGKAVLVEGRLSIRSYSSRSGAIHKAAEVVMASLQMLGNAPPEGQTVGPDTCREDDQASPLDVRYRLVDA